MLRCTLLLQNWRCCWLVGMQRMTLVLSYSRLPPQHRPPPTRKAANFEDISAPSTLSFSHSACEASISPRPAAPILFRASGDCVCAPRTLPTLALNVPMVDFAHHRLAHPRWGRTPRTLQKSWISKRGSVPGPHFCLSISPPNIPLSVSLSLFSLPSHFLAFAILSLSNSLCISRRSLHRCSTEQQHQLICALSLFFRHDADRPDPLHFSVQRTSLVL